MQETAEKIDDLDRQLDDYQEWRTNLTGALESYRDWCSSNHQLDGIQELKLLELVGELQNDALTIALVGEFSRGKTELINALFFSDYDRRLLPSTPGRTTMCPTEISYDPRLPPCIRLLPIETRKSAATLAELKKSAVNWTILPLNLDSPEAMTDMLGEILKSKRIEQRQARELGLAGLTSDAPGGGGSVEVPVWRHAVINYPNRLLKRGVVVLDTPGLNALGSEPELTLGMLPSAHAILFVLAADTGVTMSDMDIWKRHVCPATGRDPQCRIVALNKIDALWNELESPEVTAGFIQRQREETHRLLNIDRSAVFPVSAQKGLIGKIRRDDQLVARSGLPALENHLSNIAIRNRQNIICDKISRDIGAVVRESRELIRGKLELLESEKREILELGGKSTAVIEAMTDKLLQQRKTYDEEVQSFEVTRRMLSKQVMRMISILSISRFDELIDNTRQTMHNTWTTPGLRRGMETFFGGTFENLKKVDAQSEDICRLVERIYERFHGVYGLPLQVPVRFSTGTFMRQYKSLYDEAEGFRTSAAMVMTEQHFVIQKFFIVLVSRARTIYEDCNKATRSWARSVLRPIFSQIMGHRALIDQRLKNLEALRNSEAALRAREKKLASEIESLQEQAAFIDGILASIQDPSETLPGFLTGIPDAGKGRVRMNAGLERDA